MDRTETTTVEAILKDELARGDRALNGVAPVISHMLASAGHALVSDAIVARLRGMLTDIARQLIAAESRFGQNGHAALREPDPQVEGTIDDLADDLANDSAVLNHLHSIAMEGHLTERLEARASVDPVLSPLLQELVASDQPAIAELAMNTLAAQSRFMQSQRRMAMPIGELPAELFQTVLNRFETTSEARGSVFAARAVGLVKQDYNEGASRIGLLARLISAMRTGSVAALELDHAGFALFVSALAAHSRQSRELGVLACHERQAARLALSLRAAACGADAIERQFLLVQPSQRLPKGVADMPPERALALLAHSDARGAV